MEVGEIYRRNNNNRGVHGYYVVVTSFDEKYISMRRGLFDNSLVHGDVTWSIVDFLQFFEKT